MSGQDLADDLRHPQLAALLEALDQRDHGHPRTQVVGGLTEDGAAGLGGHAEDENIRLGDGLREIGGRPQRRIDRQVAEIAAVDMPSVDVLDRRLVAGPDRCRRIARGDRGDGRPPRSAAEDSDMGTAHGGSFGAGGHHAAGLVVLQPTERPTPPALTTALPLGIGREHDQYQAVARCLGRVDWAAGARLRLRETRCAPR